MAIKQIGVFILRVSISVVLLIFLFSRIDTAALLHLAASSNKLYLALFGVLVLVINAICFIRWSILLRAAGSSVALKTLLKSFSGGIFFNLFLPTTIGGDVVRTLDLASHTQKSTEAVATVFLDRLSGYVALVIVVLASCAIGWRYVQDKVVLFSVAVISCMLVVVLFVLFNKAAYAFIRSRLYSLSGGRVMTMISGAHEQMHSLGRMKRVVAINLCLSLVIQVLSPLSMYVVGRALGAEVSFMYFLVFIPVIGVITMLPVSIAGLGVRDAATVYFFAKAGLARDVALAMSLLGFAVSIIFAAAGGLYYVLTLHRRRV